MHPYGSGGTGRFSTLFYPNLSQRGNASPTWEQPDITTAEISGNLGLIGAPCPIWHDGGVVKVVIGKPGLDGHDRGARVIARALQDAGMDVVYTGLHQSAAAIAQCAVDEDADAVGLSILSGAHLTLFPAVLAELDQRGRGDLPVFGGGIIPQDDVRTLLDLGVRRIFAPGSAVSEVVDWVRDNVRPREGRS